MKKLNALLQRYLYSSKKIEGVSTRWIIVGVLVTVGVLILSNLWLITPNPYIYDKGNIVAIERSGFNSKPLILKAIGKDSHGEIIEYQVEINDVKKKEKNLIDGKDNRESKVKSTLKHDFEKLGFRRQVDKALMIDVDKKGTNEVFFLPKETESGQSINWKPIKEGFDPLGLIFFPLILGFSVVEAKEKKKRLLADRKRVFVIKLPNFINQLVLLMEGGMIFSDAYRKIAESYMIKEVKDPFEHMIVQIQEDSDEQGIPIERQLLSAVRDDEFRPMARIGNVIWDSQQKGNDILGKLMDERLILWETRKKQADDEAKKRETRLALPMAMILVALLIVTGGPAMLQIQGG